MNTERVNIIGCAPGWTLTPFDDKEAGEFWGLNDVILSHPVDVVIDVHDLKAIIKGKKTVRRRPDIVKACLKKIKKTGTLCYSVEEVKGVPNIKRYPLEKIIKEFDSDYFSGGPDYALALAIYKGFKEIHTYGILLVCQDEYYYQKPAFEHWLGVAKGRGIKTVIHDFNNLSSILRTHNGTIYGYGIPQRWKKRVIDDPTVFIDAYS